MLRTVQVVGHRPGQNAFGSSFRNQETAAAIFGDDRYKPPVEVKRDLADLPVFTNIGLVMVENGQVQRIAGFCLLQRGVDWIWKARLKGTVEVHVSETLLG